MLTVDGRTEVSLHLKLPGDLSLEEAHAVAEEVERAIVDVVPEVDAVQTHLEPLAEAGEGRTAVGGEVAARREVTRIVADCTGAPRGSSASSRPPTGSCLRDARPRRRQLPLAEAHARASEIEERIRRELPGVARSSSTPTVMDVAHRRGHR